MKKRHLVFLLSILFTILFTLTACGGNEAQDSNNNDDGVIIDFAIHVANPEDQEPAFYNVVQKFMEENPDITINLKGTDQKEHVKNMKLQSQSGNLPDMFWMLPASARELEETGALLDLTPFVENNPDLVEDFHANMLETYQIDGKQFGLPYQPLVTGFWYNQSLFDEYDLETPKTYEDLVAVSKVFNENDIAAISQGAKDPYSVWAFLTMMSRYGYFDKIDVILAGEESYNNEDFLNYYEKIDGLREAGAFSETVTTANYFQAVESFLNEDAAMLDAGHWEAKKLEESTISEDVGFWWGPTFSDGVGEQKLSSIVPAAPIVVNKEVEENQAKYDAIMEFLAFYYSQEGAQIMVDNLVPPMIQFEGEINTEDHPVFAKLVEQMNDDEWKSQQNQPDLVVSEAVANAMYDSIYGVINGTYTPEEAVNLVQEKIAK